MLTSVAPSFTDLQPRQSATPAWLLAVAVQRRHLHTRSATRMCLLASPCLRAAWSLGLTREGGGSVSGGWRLREGELGTEELGLQHYLYITGIGPSQYMGLWKRIPVGSGDGACISSPPP